MALQTIGAPGGTTPQALANRTFYSKRLIAEMFHWLVALPFGDPEDIPLNSGQTIDWRKLARFAAKTTPLVEGTAPGGSDLQITNVSATVGQYGDYVKWSDRFVETTPDPWVSETVRYQGRQAALTFDSLVLDELLNATNEMGADLTTDISDTPAGAKLTASFLRNVVKEMRLRHVPYVTRFLQPTGGIGTVPGLPSYICIIGPTTLAHLQAEITGFQTIDQYQNSNQVLPFEVGKFDSLRFVMTTNEKTVTSTAMGTPLVYPMFVLGANAFGVSSISTREIQTVLRPVGTPAPGDELGQTGSVGWKSYFVAKIKNNDAMTLAGWTA